MTLVIFCTLLSWVVNSDHFVHKTLIRMVHWEVTGELSGFIVYMLDGGTFSMLQLYYIC